MRHTWLAFLLALLLALLLAPGVSLAADADEDGTQDELDFCSRDALAPHPAGCDSDQDGYGNHCDADFDGNGVVDAADKAAFDLSYGITGVPGSLAADLNCDGTVGLPDFGIFGELSGKPVGPSGLPCAGQEGCR